MRYIIYKDRAGQWRWQLLSANNKIISDSGEAYWNKNDCLAGINLNKGSGTSLVYER